MKIEFIDNILTPEDFVRLRVTTGFADIPVPHARKALQNGLLNVSAVKDGKLIGMGRLVGDGAMYWYLQEIIVLPEYQGLGIGTMIVNHLVDYAVKNSSTGKITTIGGVSARGKEGFYEKLGFEVIPNGIQWRIKRKL
ncbi:GNAT family N-acetyltransferase [Butyrivibrio sp. XPD2002]|uniref:GNAT family N-acetyltransferase n=1 Tax=Butyrivibrio sp. XPD2002 TaxID=1280665 RepID=UPI0003F91B49|nr:GNAT family N-acetyltransferase [Butyrivibrio sp. XPD2002]